MTEDKRSRTRSAWLVFIAVLAVHALVLATPWSPLVTHAAQADDLAGRLLLALAGGVEDADILTAFPPLSHALSLAVYGLVGVYLVHPLPMVVALGVALLAASMQRHLVDGGHGAAGSAALVLLVGTHPLWWADGGAGVPTLLLAFGVWMLALGIFGLKDAQRVDRLILVALALPLMALSHGLGIAIALASFVFLAFNLPANRVVLSMLTTLSTVFFPLVLTALSVAFINWLLHNDALYLIKTWLGTVPNAAAPAGSRTEGAIAPVLALKPTLVLLAPLLLVALLLAWKQDAGTGKARAAVSLTFIVVVAMGGIALLNVPLQGAAALVAAAVVLVGVAAAAPGGQVPAAWPLAAVGMSWVVTLALMAAAVLDLPMTAITGVKVQPGLAFDPARAQELGAALRDRQDVLFDAASAPAVIAHRRSGWGIHAARTPEFQLAILSGEFEHAHVVVRNPRSLLGADQLSRRFPNLYDEGHPGYTLSFDDPVWRIYQRNRTTREER